MKAAVALAVVICALRGADATPLAGGVHRPLSGDTVSMLQEQQEPKPMDVSGGDEEVDPGKAQLQTLNKDVAKTLGMIRREEGLRKQRLQVARQLEKSEAEEQRVSGIRQAKFKKQIANQEKDEEKKTEMTEEKGIKDEEDKAVKTPANKKVMENWDVVVEKDKGVITAEELDPTVHDRFLHFNKYTEEMTDEEKANEKAEKDMQKLKADAAARCDGCKEKCKTDTCNNWCDMRWCNEAVANVDIDSQPLASQESIVNDADESAVQPATKVVCKMCEMPATEEKRQWCKEQGC